MAHVAEWERAQEEMRAYGEGGGDELYILRVNQVDATLIEHQVYMTLLKQLESAVKPLHASFHIQYGPELRFFLQSIMFYFGMYQERASFGMSVQNLRYDKPSGVRRALLLYYVLYIVGGWGYERLSRRAQQECWLEDGREEMTYRVAKWMKKVEKVVPLLSLLHFIVFLYQGKYYQWIERVLQLRPVYHSKNSPKVHNFEMLNTQLVWEGFADFIVFFMPIVKSRFWRRWIRKLFHFTCRLIPALKPKQVDLWKDGYVTDSCMICRDRPCTNPYQIKGCGHIGCYYCLSTLLLVDEHASCVLCGKDTPIDQIIPFQVEG